MKTKTIIISFFTILLFIFTSCNKYKSDEILGEWDIESYHVNDYDSTAFFNQFEYSHIIITDSESDHIVLQFVRYHDFMTIVFEGNWNLTKRNTQLTMQYNTVYNHGVENWFEIGPFTEYAFSDWGIKHLSNSSFQLECKMDGNNYKLNLTK